VRTSSEHCFHIIVVVLISKKIITTITVSLATRCDKLLVLLLTMFLTLGLFHPTACKNIIIIMYHTLQSMGVCL